MNSDGHKEMAQLVKCLLCQYGDLSSVHITMSNLGKQVTQGWRPRTGKALELADQQGSVRNTT